jgi:lipopolysaccharide transport system permease protein
VPTDPSSDAPVLDLRAEPDSARAWLRAMVAHRGVLVALASKDFKVRYKRATLGVLWAVALPLVQSVVMIAVFSRFVRVETEGLDYMGYVLAGMVPWAYLGVTIPSASTGVVDGAGLTDKVWFPRALLVLAPIVANLIGLAITLGIVIPVEVARGNTGLDLLLLVPATALLLVLTVGVGLVASAAYVWFRDVRFIVQAVMLVAFYATPVLYPVDVLGRLRNPIRANPFTGAVSLFQAALAGTPVDRPAVAVTVVVSLVLLVFGVELHRRRDRLFVDLL